MPTSPRTVDADGSPVCTASTSAECVAESDAETIRKQGAILHIPIRAAERRRHSPRPARGKDSKTIGFGGVLSSLSFAEERKGAAGCNVLGKKCRTIGGQRRPPLHGDRGCGLPRAQSALAMTHCKECGVRRDTRIPPYSEIIKPFVGQGPCALPGSAVQARPGPSRRPALTHPLPIELRRGRCPHRPADTGFHMVHIENKT